MRVCCLVITLVPRGAWSRGDTPRPTRLHVPPRYSRTRMVGLSEVVMSVFGRGVFQTRWPNRFDAAGSEGLGLGEMRATTNPGNQADAENQNKSAGARS
jgi:hypothetical protein